MVHEIEPLIGLCPDSMDPAWDSLSVPAPTQAHYLSLFLSLFLSLKKKQTLKVLFLLYIYVKKTIPECWTILNLITEIFLLTSNIQIVNEQKYKS